MIFSKLDGRKSTLKTKLFLQIGKNKDEKCNRRYLFQSFHKLYHVFSRHFEELFEEVKKNNKKGNPRKIQTHLLLFEICDQQAH